MKFSALLHWVLPALLLSAVTSSAPAQDYVSRTLTDAIYRGEGTINLLKNISGDQLTKYFSNTGGLLLLGADVNEDNSGNERSSSLGIAIKQVQLSITTSAGSFTFKDFFTSTTSMLRESGSSTSSQYYTMFGQGGSSQLTGSGGFDLSRFDDVLWLQNVSISGTITNAQLSVSFLNTPSSKANDAESFFDFSGGFEDFALLSIADAALLEKANLGMAGAPAGVTYQTVTPVTTVIDKTIASTQPAPTPTPTAPAPAPTADTAPTAPTAPAESPAPTEVATTGPIISPAPETSSPTGGGSGAGTPIVTAPAAPAPPFLMVAAMGLLLVWKNRFHRHDKA